MNGSIVVEEWDEKHPRWLELLRVVDTLDQSSWAAARFEWHQSTHMGVALQNGDVVGFLRFVVQTIGLEDDHAPVALDGRNLTEAKILAFGVLPDNRRQGIGYLLQEHAMKRAAELGCYQVRSHSSGANTANHRLKLKMGFGVQPVVRGDDVHGVYFIMPLRASLRPSTS